MSGMIAGIDVHKRVLVVAVAVASEQWLEAGCTQSIHFEQARFGTTVAQLKELAIWLKEGGVTEVVMESTAQYWKPVWLALEKEFKLVLAQAWSNRAPKGRKTDYRDARRLVRRHLAGELTLSYVPDAEQREMRMLTGRSTQLRTQRIRLQNHLEALLEECGIKLSSVVSDLLGASGRRILQAIVDGTQEADKLAELGDERLKCTREELRDAVSGEVSELMRRVLGQQLQQVDLTDAQLKETAELAASTMQQYQEAITRLVAVPGIRVLAAQQIVAEAGPRAEAFPTAAQFASWIGCCPGTQESAGENQSGRCPKGNKYLRRLLCQMAQAAVKTKNSYFQSLFRRLVPRLGFQKTIWAVARHMAVVVWKILHQQASYEEKGHQSSPQAVKRRAQRLARELRALNYTVIEPNPGCTV